MKKLKLTALASVLGLAACSSGGGGRPAQCKPHAEHQRQPEQPKRQQQQQPVETFYTFQSGHALAACQSLQTGNAEHTVEAFQSDNTVETLHTKYTVQTEYVCLSPRRQCL
ncbi:TPA: hypothetical protein ACFNMY_001866 [Neisseria bacilliformis]|uniref:hypothetical protein n=1 Tax=Neisseria bacilliformis TaxID=267212 RepID=UPI001C70BAE6|nr:hypothetical protein [Neisseria bacilliformis]